MSPLFLLCIVDESPLTAFRYSTSSARSALSLFSRIAFVALSNSIADLSLFSAAKQWRTPSAPSAVPVSEARITPRRSAMFAMRRWSCSTVERLAAEPCERAFEGVETPCRQCYNSQCNLFPVAASLGKDRGREDF